MGIFKVADVEKGNIERNKTSKKVSLLEQLKQKHRDQATPSDEEEFLNDEIETMIPKVTFRQNESVFKRSEINKLKMGRKVTVHDKKQLKRSQLARLQPSSQTDSGEDSDSITSKVAKNSKSKAPGLSVKDRLTLTTQLKK